MVLLGTLINGISVLVCSALGTIVKSRLPKRICDGVIKALSLCILYIGIDGMLSGENPLIAIISIAIGGFIGEIFDLDKIITRFGSFVQKRLLKNEKSGIIDGFISASLMICVGAWAITGAMDAGLRGDHSSFIAKAVVDGVSTFVLASTMGIGVVFSAFVLIVYQGGIALLSTVIQPYLTESLINELSCVGSLLIIAIAFNMMGVTKFKVVNLLPAILMPFILCLFI